MLSEKSECCTSSRGYFQDPRITRQLRMMDGKNGSETSIDIGLVDVCWIWAAMVADWMVSVVPVWHEASAVWSWIRTVDGGLILDFHMRYNKKLIGYSSISSRTMVR